MVEQIARRLEKQANIPRDTTMRFFRRLGIGLAATLFVLIATLLVAFEDVLPGRASIGSLQIGDLAPTDIRATEAKTYTSEVLTEQQRQLARDSVPIFYDPPDPNVARIQTQLARQILDFIDNVRRDPFATPEQKTRDVNQITALTLEPNIIEHVLEVNTETWKDVDDQIVNVLERVMRESIRDIDLVTILDQLPTQVSVRFGQDEAEVIVAIVEDLVRPNRVENPDATEAARNAAVAAVEPIERSFERGQIVVSEGNPIDALNLEALTNLGVLKPPENRFQEIIRVFLASVIVMVVIGLYIARFKPSLLYHEPRMLSLLAVLFLIMLAGARFLGGNGQVYIYPTATLALLFVTIIGPEIAFIGTLGLALLIGLMAGNSLEIATLVGVGGLIGTLTLRRAERLNSYFFAGLMIAMANTGVVAIFNLSTPLANQSNDPSMLLIYSMLNGILSAAAAVAGMYMVTQLFNLPTSLKLVELSQPNQPLMQRLLREAPGTYQHSLQVGNLAEQATNAIGGNAELVRVAALYHDVGKILNPAFFTENQHDLGNPHDLLNDPYRSADIIIRHVTDGYDLAKHYRLPSRIRDFILEHHGTTQVYVFYQRAINEADGDESAVDLADFTYPGPKPQSRETAALMLADSCEAAVRSIQPKSKKEIEDVVQRIIESKRQAGQLDESRLTLNDLKTIHNIFVEMLQALFHPRIDYAAAASKLSNADRKPKPAAVTPASVPKVVTSEVARTSQEVKPVSAGEGDKRAESQTESGVAAKQATNSQVPVGDILDDDDSPLSEVPPLPRSSETRASGANDGNKGKKAASQNGQEEARVEEDT